MHDERYPFLDNQLSGELRARVILLVAAANAKGSCFDICDPWNARTVVANPIHYCNELAMQALQAVAEDELTFLDPQLSYRVMYYRIPPMLHYIPDYQGISVARLHELRSTCIEALTMYSDNINIVLTSTWEDMVNEIGALSTDLYGSAV